MYRSVRLQLVDLSALRFFVDIVFFGAQTLIKPLSSVFLVSIVHSSLVLRFFCVFVSRVLTVTSSPWAVYFAPWALSSVLFGCLRLSNQQALPWSIDVGSLERAARVRGSWFKSSLSLSLRFFLTRFFKMSRVDDVLVMSKSELMRRKTSITKDDLIQALVCAKTGNQERESSIQMSESRLAEIIGKQLEKHMQQLSSKIEFLLESNKTISARCNELQREVEIMKKEKSVDVTNEVAERIIRRRNVVMAGIPECTQGSVTDRKSEDEQRVREVRAVLGCASDGMEEASRLGRIQFGKDRLLRVRFEKEEDRQQILRCAPKLKAADQPWMRNVFINPDRTRLEQDQYRILRNELKRRRQNGEKVFIRSGKVLTEEELEAKNFH